MAIRTVPLSHIIKLERRAVKIEPNKLYQEIGIFSHGKGIFHKEPRYGYEVGDKKLFLIKKDDFIFQITFAWEGAIAFTGKSEEGLFCSTRFPTFKVNEEICDPNYLLFYFKTKAGLHQIGKISPGSAGRNRVLSLKRMSEVNIPLPTLKEQQRIAFFLSDQNYRMKRVIKIKSDLEKLSKIMLNSIFLKIIQDSKLKKMKEIAPCVRRKINIDINVDYPELGVRSFGKGTFHKPSIHGAEIVKKMYKIESGDLIFNNVFAWEGAVAVAKPEDDGRFGSHRFITCIPNANIITSNFLKFYFLTNEGLKKLGDASPGGALRNRTLNIKSLQECEVPVPDLMSQLWFDRILMKIDEVKRLQAETVREIVALEQAMLAKTFGIPQR